MRPASQRLIRIVSIDRMASAHGSMVRVVLAISSICGSVTAGAPGSCVSSFLTNAATKVRTVLPSVSMSPPLIANSISPANAPLSNAAAAIMRPTGYHSRASSSPRLRSARRDMITAGTASDRP
jgi:hypothetical protein